MQYLSRAAKAYCTKALAELDRAELVSMLEAICIACYDDESVSNDLVPSAIDSIEAGDIEFDWSFAASKQYGHAAQMFWLDIDDVWVVQPENEGEDDDLDE